MYKRPRKCKTRVQYACANYIRDAVTPHRKSLHRRQEQRENRKESRDERVLNPESKKKIAHLQKK